jgi:ABC-type dipeptide/oligopeptide/nickel transport system ATPase component
MPSGLNSIPSLRGWIFVIRSLVHEQGRTVMAAIHALNLAAAFCDQVIALREGRLFRTGVVAEVLAPAFIADVFQVGAEIHALSPSLACSARSRCGGATPADGLFFQYLCPKKLRGKEKKAPIFLFLESSRGLVTQGGIMVSGWRWTVYDCIVVKISVFV